jgi:hypothetical protein
MYFKKKDQIEHSQTGDVFTAVIVDEHAVFFQMDGDPTAGFPAPNTKLPAGFVHVEGADSPPMKIIGQDTPEDVEEPGIESPEQFVYSQGEDDDLKVARMVADIYIAHYNEKKDVDKSIIATKGVMEFLLKIKII